MSSLKIPSSARRTSSRWSAVHVGAGRGTKGDGVGAGWSAVVGGAECAHDALANRTAQLAVRRS